MARIQYDPLLNQTLHTLFPMDHEKSFIQLKSLTNTRKIYDVLSRKDHHHLMLRNPFSPLFTQIYLQNIAQFLTQEKLPSTLKNATFFWLDYRNFNLQGYELARFENIFTCALAEDNIQSSTKILALSANTPEIFFKNLIDDPLWRLIFMIEADQQAMPFKKYCTDEIILAEPTQDENIKFLASYHSSLEKFHQIKISEPCYLYALEMANQYLSGNQPAIDKTLKLLDSSCARASMIEQFSAEIPTLTPLIIAEVVSEWTQIPLAHLQQVKMNAVEFTANLHKIIYGQDAALRLIGLTMQHTSLKLMDKPGTKCNFLFAGPDYVGKRITAYALAEQLFGHKQALLPINLDKNLNYKTLNEVKIIRQQGAEKSLFLLKAIQETPSVVFLLENIEKADPLILNLFADIFTHGIGYDENHQPYDFKNAIFILTTTWGAERIISLTKYLPPKEEVQSLDLMSLVMNQADQESTTTPKHLSPQELCSEIMPALESHFSANLLRHFNIIPFILLDYAALEKIIRQKLKIFANKLAADYGIEFSYAPEAIRYLVQESLWDGGTNPSLDKILEQHLYTSAAQELLANIENPERSQHLHLQLNDTGQLLRCTFMKMEEGIVS